MDKQLIKEIKSGYVRLETLAKRYPIIQTLVDVWKYDYIIPYLYYGGIDPINHVDRFLEEMKLNLEEQGLNG